MRGTTENSLAIGNTALRLRRLKEAEDALLEYRKEGAEVMAIESRRLMQLMDAGWSAADAADTVQAEYSE